MDPVRLLLGVALILIGLEILSRRVQPYTEGDTTRSFPQPDRRATRIVVLGDSIAYGHGLDEAQAWPALVARRLVVTYPHHPWQVVNAGVPGDTVADAYVRFPAHVAVYQPHILIIALGLNDCYRTDNERARRRLALFRRHELTWWGKSFLLRRLLARLFPPAPLPRREDEPAIPADDFARGLAWLVQQGRRLGTRPVLLTMTPLDPTVFPPAGAEAQTWSAYNAIIRDTARRLEVPFIEVSHTFPMKQPWQADGVHLTPEGQALLAERVWQGLHRPPLASVLHLQGLSSNAEMAPSLE
jgi:lysophospholipase L1-like esterase